MKFPLTLLAVCLFLLPNQRASAQIEQGQLRLYFDVSLLAYTAQTIRAQSYGSEVTVVDGTLDLGTGLSSMNGAGFGVAYAAGDYVLPGLYLSYQRIKLSRRQDVDTQSTEGPERAYHEVELRPYLEAVLNPQSSVVGYGLLGASYLRRSYATKRIPEEDGGSREGNGYGVGPVVGIGVHAFAGERASFDFSFSFRYLFRHDDDLMDALTESGDFSDIELRETTAMLQFGASFWP